MTRRPLEQIMAGLGARRAALELQAVDLAFLVALHVGGLVSYSEVQLEDAFAAAASAVDAEAKPRATSAIQRLRAQRLLARVDGQGVVRAGEFALTRLATGIVEFFLEEDALTRETLGALTASLRTGLSGVLAAAQTPGADWREIEAPLRASIADLVAGIERRQRGLDLQQEDFQTEIRRLLEADWFGALERCQALLESTSATLRELNDVLLRDGATLLGLLHEIEELAVAAGATEAEAAAHRLTDQLDRSLAWGAARQRAWSEYFQYVHRYLRDVVRLDPSRALTQRLRDQLAGKARFALIHASAPPMRVLRTVGSARVRPPVVRPRAAREKDPAPDTGEDPQAVLEEKVRGSLSRGAAALSAVTVDVTADLPDAERFVEAGRVAHAVSQLARATSAIERPWVAAGGDLEIEDWRVEKKA
ncbi:MAG TPA: hypothetical protein VGM88_11085 [Kofleriaceae bacterium]